MRREFNIIFWLGIIFFLGVSGLAGWSLLQLHNEIQLREETSRIEDKLGDLYDTLLEADVTFLILRNSEDESDMNKLLKLTKVARRQVDDLSNMVNLKSQIHGQVNDLHQMVVEKVNLSDKLMSNLDLEAPEPFERALVIQDDLLLTQKVNEKIKTIEAHVLGNLEKHRAYVGRYFSVNMITIASAVMMTFFFFLTFARLVSGEIDRRQSLEKDLRQAQEAAIQASNLKSQFLATVSHEIRTPLNGIIGMSEILADRVSGEAAKYAQILQGSGRTLLRIVNDILDFSRIEANRVEFEMQEVQLSAVLESAIELYSLQAKTKNIELSCTYDPRLQNYFAADGARLSQVVHNLVSNAIKFTDTGTVEVLGEIITGSNDEFRVKVSVNDTGPGIEEDKLGLVFEPFYQTKAHHQHEGTGLGLAISKKLVEQMGGSIGFIRRAPTGSQFWFEIVLRKIKESSAAGASAEGPAVRFVARPMGPLAENGVLQPIAQGLNARDVLLIEDNPTNQILAQAQIEQLGHLVHVASNGEEGVIAARDREFSLILMDCRMPVLDGFEATRRIREGELELNRKRVPIVAMTANVLEEDRQRCIAAGMDDYLAKPFVISTLRKVFDKWLPSAVEAVDWATLADLEGKLSRDVVVKLIKSFILTLPATMNEINDAYESKDYAQFAALAHRLKSSAAALGARRLAEICERAEKQGHYSSRIDADLYEEFTAEFVKVLSEFKNQKKY